MKLCRELGIDLCGYCIGHTSSSSCAITNWKHYILKTKDEELINKYLLYITNDVNYYLYKTIELYKPELFEKLNKLAILK
jgi:hypothetical protein